MNGRVHRWRVEDLTKNGPMQKRMLLKSYATNYWIGTVPPEIIKDHGDIWSPSCMQMLAGIYRMTQQLPRKSPTAAPTSRPD